jgi:predicted DNA-binding protein (MmcQ/YjbR family)
MSTTNRARGRPRRRAPTAKKPAPKISVVRTPADSAILRRLRAVCLALPEATEKIAWGEPTFRVRDKMFAMFTDNHHGDGRVALWCKAPPGAQEILVGAAPKRFFVPPYVGHKGWIGVRLDVDVDWDEVADLVADAHGMTAPKKRSG